MSVHQIRFVPTVRARRGSSAFDGILVAVALDACQPQPEPAR